MNINTDIMGFVLGTEKSVTSVLLDIQPCLCVPRCVSESARICVEAGSQLNPKHTHTHTCQVWLHNMDKGEWTLCPMRKTLGCLLNNSYN